MSKTTSAKLLQRMNDGDSLSTREQASMIVRLSIPAILAQVSNIIMQYIDAGMVGQLGADDSAAIGLVSAWTWLCYGLCVAASVGFTVRIAHRIGAKEDRAARNIVKTGLICTVGLSLLLLAAGAALSAFLPAWMGGEEAIRPAAASYFLVFALSLPFVQLNMSVSGMLECSGNMKLPGFLQIVMCVLDVVFNFLLIFPSRTVNLFGAEFSVWGAGRGATGAALGTALSEAVISLFMLWYLLFRDKKLRLHRGEGITFSLAELRETLRIAAPAALERVITGTAYIAFTRIVSPLGTIAVAANSFSITAESLCYEPGFGISMAATTVIGQSLGARRYDLTKRLGRMSVWLGVAVMTVSGVLLYLFAPQLIGLLSPDESIRELGAAVLRIEAFAEPLFAASIVSTGVFRGAGDTVVPSVLSFVSMWLVRIPLAYALSLSFGLRGVWTAMCIELCLRGVLFIVLQETRFRRRTERGLYVKG